MKLKYLASLILPICYANNSLAADDLFQMPIEQLMQINIESATLTDETILTVPSSVAVFSKQDIQKQGLDTLNELLNFVTGIQSRQSDRDARFNRITFRGRASGSGASSVLILLNGQRINSEYSGGNDFTFPLIPLSIIEKVEVIKGSGSALYGSNAFLGVINLITQSDTQPSLNVKIGQHNHKSITASAGFKKDDLSIQAIISYEKDSGAHYRNEINTYNPTQRLDINDPISRKEFILNAHYKNTKLDVIYTNQASEDFYVQGHISKGFNKTETQSLIANLTQTFKWQKNLTSQLHLDIRDNKATLHTQVTPPNIFFPISVPQSTAPLLGITPIHEKAQGIRFNSFYDRSDDLQFSVGLEYRKSKMEDNLAKANYQYSDCITNIECQRYLASLSIDPTNPYIPSTPINLTYFEGDFFSNTPFLNPSEREIYGAFAQSQYKITNATEITLGVRYDDYSDIGNNISPRLSIVSEINARNTLKFNYGEAYRAPQFNELNIINNPNVQSNPQLKPETIHSYDLIWIHNLSQVNFISTYFEHTVKDSIITPIQAGRVQLINLPDSQKTKGAELESTWAISEDFSLKLGITRIFSSPDSQYRETKSSAFLVAGYQFERWHFNTAINYQGSKQTPVTAQGDLLKLQSHTTVNTKVSYQFNPDTTAYFQAKNLFNKEYRTPALANSALEGIPNRGRQLFLGADFSF